MRSGAVKQPSAICKAIVKPTRMKCSSFLHMTPDEWRALARPTTERLQVLLRPITSRHILLRSPRFTTAYYACHKHRDCRGRFFDSIKIGPGIHGNHGLSRLLIPSPHVVSRPSRFDHGGLKRDCRGCRDPSVNVALSYSAVKLFSKYSSLCGKHTSASRTDGQAHGPTDRQTDDMQFHNVSVSLYIYVI